jgi:hypothetical protein
MKYYEVYSADLPWFVEIEFRFHPKIKDLIKEIPGSKWNQENKRWLVPTDMLDYVEDIFRKEGFDKRC